MEERETQVNINENCSYNSGAFDSWGVHIPGISKNVSKNGNRYVTETSIFK